MHASRSVPTRLATAGVILITVLAAVAFLSTLIFVYAVWLFPHAFVEAFNNSGPIQDNDGLVMNYSWAGCTGLGLLVSWYRAVLSPRFARLLAVSLIFGFGSVIPWIMASLLGVSWPVEGCMC